MRILFVTDAWLPHAQGVVTLLVELARALQAAGHEVVVIHPGQFRSRPCPGQRDMDLVLFPGRRLQALMEAARPEAIHLATEGPLGWAARRHCLRQGLPFTTAFHADFPEILRATLGLPLAWGRRLSRRFHRVSQAVMVPGAQTLEHLSQAGMERLRLGPRGVDGRLFALADPPLSHPPLGPLARPVSLYVGRISHDRNIEDFLRLDVPGSKVVCGDGPLASGLRHRYPNVHWLGVLPRQELARVYGAADVFVFPTRQATLGLAMLEAMACGVPVAAYPVDGPMQLLGAGRAGAMHQDLRKAWRRALTVRRFEARSRALEFGWARAAEQFVAQLCVLPQAPVRNLGVTQTSFAR
ncbi:glycosyltransferase [Hydrogenophaga sp.]|uniref:glycosyltransferase n=1 Tax=Hydrogenophaga sp. TaxID=1904254 RepID=UPI0026307CCD|nr:glycosyltransferase [Hydrogenophaga sp.]MCW5654670.1 glycosyltransferase [Hydrogenophaga sp.]